jgi:hypothetical protein
MELCNLFKKLFNIAPLLIIAMGVFMYYLVRLAINYPNTIYFVLCPLVLFMAIFLYSKTKSYGEASLALTAGLFAVFGITWTPASLFGVIGTWFLFTVVVFLVSCIRQAMVVEDITKQAAIKFAQKNGKEVAYIENSLENIRKSPARTNMLSGEDICEIFRCAAFKNIKLEHVEQVVRLTEILHVITKVSVKNIALVGCEIISYVNPQPEESETVIDMIYCSIQASPASPEEYFEICSKAIKLAQRHNIKTIQLIQSMPYYFIDGYSDVYEFVKSLD